jgi:hypothetical protein
MADHSVDKLTKCIKDCRGNAACVTACEVQFVAEGGTIVPVQEGGKVFTSATGGKVFITNGGKVF